MKPHIFYADGSVYTGDAINAPVRGVICIVQQRPDKRNYLIDGKSHYVFNGNTWLPCTWDDVEEFYLYRREVKIIVIRGMVVDPFEHQKIWERANKLV